MLLRTISLKLARTAPLGHNFSVIARLNVHNTAMNARPTPWFVDEQDELPPSGAGVGGSGVQTQIVASPPPADAPAPLIALHAHLLTLPLLESVSVLHASSFDDFQGRETPLPTQRPHGKRRRGSASFGGDGVGDPPPIWNWILQVQVKDGAEKRGAVNVVVRSAIKAVSDNHTSWLVSCFSVCINHYPYSSYPQNSRTSISQQKQPCGMSTMDGGFLMSASSQSTF